MDSVDSTQRAKEQKAGTLVKYLTSIDIIYSVDVSLLIVN